MNAVWANELFTPRDGVGETATYGRQMHAFWINGNENVEMLPGVITDWQVSEDGLSWDVTLREGITFHNGDPLTIDDALFTMEFVFGPEAIETSLSPSVSSRGGGHGKYRSHRLHHAAGDPQIPQGVFPLLHI